MIKAVIFDLDGTLLYTLEDLKDSLNFALQKFNYPSKTLDEVRNFVGNGVRLLVERSIPNGEKNPDLEDVLNIFTPAEESVEEEIAPIIETKEEPKTEAKKTTKKATTRTRKTTTKK